jgi:large subunit ribosomal protein L13
MGTFFQSKEDALSSSKWLVVDAEGVPLGRLASQVAALIRGKHKPTFTPHVDGGDFVVVLNASKVKLTGRKLDNKIYRYHSGHIGTMKEMPAGHLLAKNPARMVEQAVQGMLPKGPLGYGMIKKLKVYSGNEHPHSAQKPVAHAVITVN